MVFSHLRPGALHISLGTLKTLLGGWRKRTNEQKRDWLSSKRKKGKVYVTLLYSSPCICRLSRACILRETSTKPLGMLTHLLTALLPSSHCLLPLTVILSQLDSYLKPTVFFCQLTLSVFSGTFLSLSTSSLTGDLALRPFVWVLRQKRQRDPLGGANTNGNECYASCHTINCQVFLSNTNNLFIVVLL